MNGVNFFASTCSLKGLITNLPSRLRCFEPWMGSEHILSCSNGRSVGGERLKLICRMGMVRGSQIISLDYGGDLLQVLSNSPDTDD